MPDSFLFRTITALLAVSALALGTAATAARPLVVVTIHPYFDIASQIGGEYADFVQLLPAGTSPHTYDPTPRAVQQVSRADLLIRNGGVGLDDWLLRLITASGSRAPLLSIMDSIEFTPLGTSAHQHGAEHDDHPEDGTTDLESGDFFVNAHVWLDVTNMMSAAEAIRDALTGIDPANAEAYAANTELLLADLAALDREILTALEPIRGAAFVPFHDAWPYFAQRYGLDLVLEIEPFPGREPSPAYIARALEEIRKSGARALFSERQLSPRPAEVVAEAAGIPLYVLDPEGGGAAGVESYQQLMRFNAAVLLEALAD
jgi:zinc transport system substrate-binding protein/manganese/iron transport system substrate-binding protein